MMEDLFKKFVENTQMYKGDYLQISDSVLNTFIEEEYSFYEDYGKLFYAISLDKFEDVIFEFLNTFDPKLLNIYKKMKKESMIFKTDVAGISGYGGLHFPMDSLKSSIILYDKNNENLTTAKTIVHELGHAYENKICYTSCLDNISVLRDVSPFNEVCSRFLEYAFLNYLREKRLYNNDVDICLRIFYKNMLYYNYNINMICNSSCLYINKYGYAVIDDPNLSKYANGLMKLLNYYSVSSELGEEIGYKNSFIYGLGGLFAIYLYDSYKKDPNYFIKEFRNVLINYPAIGMEAFERVGITKDKLIEGKILKKTIQNI